MTNLATLQIVVSATISTQTVAIHQPGVDLDVATISALSRRARQEGVSTHVLLEQALTESTLSPYYITEAKLDPFDAKPTRNELRSELRAEGWCMNGKAHGQSVQGGRCQRCLNIKQKSDRKITAQRKVDRKKDRAA